MMRIATVAGLAALFVSATNASAKVMTTPPFPGSLLDSGQAGCQATNVGKKSGELSIELVDNIGTVLGSMPLTVVPPGSTPLTVLVSISVPVYPTFCRFDFKGKFNGVFFYRNGAQVEVVPAVK